MHKTTILLSAVLLCVVFTNARAQWVQMAKLGGGIFSNGVFTEKDGYLFIGITLGGGVFRSSDSGTTWIAVNSGLTNTHIWALAVNGNNLFAGTDSIAFLSTDNGGMWAPLNSGWVRYTGINTMLVNGAALFVGIYYGGVFRSTDTGRSWIPLNSGLTDTNVTALAVVGSNLFAGTGSYYGNGGGVFLSTDTGKSWTTANSGLTNTNVLALAADGRNIFTGTLGGGVFRSTDTGNMWTAVNSGLTDLTINALLISGTNLFAGTGSGVFLSTNSGDTWSSVSTGLPAGTNIMALLVYSGYIFAGSNDGYVYRRPLSEMVAVRYAQNPQRPQNLVDLHVDRNNNLRYSLAEAATVSLKVYDMRGRVIHSSIPGRQSAGTYFQPLSTGRLSAGTYIVDFTTGDFRMQRLFAIM